MNSFFKIALFSLIAFAGTSHADETRITANIGDQKSSFILTVEQGKYFMFYEANGQRTKRSIGKKNHDYVTQLTLKLISGADAVKSRNPGSCSRDATEIRYIDDSGKLLSSSVCLFDRSPDSARVQELINLLFMGL